MLTGRRNIVAVLAAAGAVLAVLALGAAPAAARNGKFAPQSCPREDRSKWTASDSDSKQITKDLKYLNRMTGGGARSAKDKGGKDDGADDELPFDLFDWLCLTGIMPNAKKCFQLLSINKMEEWKMMRCCGVMKVECPSSVSCLFNVVCPNTIPSCEDRRR